MGGSFVFYLFYIILYYLIDMVRSGTAFSSTPVTRTYVAFDQGLS